MIPPTLYYYAGNCVNSFDGDGESLISAFLNVSDFAVQEESGERITVEEFLSRVLDPVAKITRKCSFSSYPERDCLVMYNPVKDVHYFYTKTGE